MENEASERESEWPFRAKTQQQQQQQTNKQQQQQQLEVPQIKLELSQKFKTIILDRHICITVLIERKNSSNNSLL